MNFLGPQNGSAGPKKSWAFWGPPRGASSSAAPPANAAVLMALGYGEANNGGTAHAAAFPFFCEGHCQRAMHAAGAMRVSVKRDPNSAGTYGNTHEWANWCEQCYVMLTNAAREFEMVRLSRLPHRRAAAVCRAATDLRSVQADKNDAGVGLAAGLPTAAADAGAGASIIAPIVAAGAAASNYISAAAAGWGTAAGFNFADGDDEDGVANICISMSVRRICCARAAAHDAQPELLQPLQPPMLSVRRPSPRLPDRRSCPLRRCARSGRAAVRLRQGDSAPYTSYSRHLRARPRARAREYTRNLHHNRFPGIFLRDCLRLQVLTEAASSTTRGGRGHADGRIFNG